MGWVILAVLGAVTLAALIRFGKLPRQLWQVVAAAIVLSASGYALQGHPTLAGSPANPVASKGETAAAMIEMRTKMDAHFSAARPWLIPADSFARDGNFRTANVFIRSGLRDNPDSADLWVAQGVLLMLASDGTLSPPAKLAFDKARAGRPSGHPGPDYYEGLAELFDGRVDLTLKRWQGLVDGASDKADWKPKLESQIAGLKELMERAPQQQPAPAATP